MRVKIKANDSKEYSEFAGREGTQVGKGIGVRLVRLDGDQAPMQFPVSLVEAVAVPLDLVIPQRKRIKSEEEMRQSKPFVLALEATGLVGLPLHTGDNPNYEPVPHVADLCADHHYARVVGRLKPVIDVLAVESLGYGDLLFGLRAARALRAMGATVRLVSNDIGAKKIVDLRGDREFEVNVFDSVAYSVAVKEKKIPAPRLVLQGPVIDMVALTEVDHVTKAAPGVPFVKINEYGFSVRQAARREQAPTRGYSGVAMSELGVFLDHRLRAEHGRGDLRSVEGVAGESLRKTLIENVNKGNHLYLAYAHTPECLKRYLHMVLLLEARDAKTAGHDVDLVVAFSSRLGNPTLCLRACDDLYESSFDDVFTVFPDKDETNKIYEKSLDVEVDAPLNEQVTTLVVNRRRRLRLVSAPIAHVDMVTLMTVCEPLVCATGDQSATEALSAGKVMVYERFDHKKDFFKSLCVLWKTLFNNDLLAALATKDPKECVEMLSDGEAEKMSTHFRGYLEESCNLERRLATRVTRCLLRALVPSLVEHDEAYVSALLDPDTQDDQAERALHEAIRSALEEGERLLK